MSDLKPCPFCGDDNLGHAADCYMALCKLPDLPSHAVMEAAWNRRTPQPVTPAGGEVEPRTDRQMLLYLDYQFAGESWVCGRCGNEEPTNGCDSHIALQRHLYTSPTVAVDDAMIDRATAAFLKDNLVQRIVDRARMKAAIDAALNQRCAELPRGHSIEDAKHAILKKGRGNED